jgi:hypothetical protein
MSKVFKLENVILLLIILKNIDSLFASTYLHNFMAFAMGMTWTEDNKDVFRDLVASGNWLIGEI